MKNRTLLNSCVMKYGKLIRLHTPNRLFLSRSRISMITESEEVGSVNPQSAHPHNIVHALNSRPRCRILAMELLLPISHSRHGQEQSMIHVLCYPITFIWRFRAKKLGKNDNEMCKNATFDEITSDDISIILILLATITSSATASSYIMEG